MTDMEETLGLGDLVLFVPSNCRHIRHRLSEFCGGTTGLTDVKAVVGRLYLICNVKGTACRVPAEILR